jgi:hypothetical protein
MPINLLVKPADAKTKKRFTAIFRIHKGGKVIKITNFGQIGGKTYLDEGDKIKRKNYRARHKGDLDTKDFKRAGYLSRFLLWGDKPTLAGNLKDYKKKFNLD